MTTDYEKAVWEIVRDVWFEMSPLEPDATVEGLNVDSIDIILLLEYLEDEFSEDIPLDISGRDVGLRAVAPLYFKTGDGEEKRFDTLGEMVAILVSHLPQPAVLESR